MSKGFTQDGNILTLTAPYAVSAGGGALVGFLFGVAVNDVANGAEGEFAIVGCHDVAAASGAGTDWTQGTKLYWDNSNKVITKASSGNTLIGAATGAKTTSAAKGNVRLNGTV